jgi:cell division protein FtsI/penicillin-binding protein 2
VKGIDLGAERQRRLVTRALPLAVIALISFIVGAATGSEPPPETKAAERFVEAWASQDFAAMHAELSAASQKDHPVEDLTSAYLDAQSVSTLESIDPGEPSDPATEDGVETVTVPVTIDTIAFGEVEGEVKLPFDGGGITWDPAMVFPGLEPGETLDTNVRLAKRGPILARDGTPLATGEATEREHPIGDAALDITGEIGEAEPDEALEFAAQGFPEGTPVGINGLEQAFNTYLAGTPGGELMAVPEPGETSQPRVLASSDPEPGRPLRTTIDADLQVATVDAMSYYGGGAAVLDARSGDIRALAQSAWSLPQPPGSAFKIFTTVGALQKKIVSFDDTFEVVTGADFGGRYVSNAGGEACGGTFPETFAHSCNSVFGPLGIDLGERALVSVSERFGFNRQPALYNDEATAASGPPAPTIPTDLGDSVDIGVTAIGQGKVLATPLLMASASQAVANDGVLSPTSLVLDPELRPDAEPVRVMSKKIAKQMNELMVGVVDYGTADTIDLSEFQIAGKTGTAELGYDDLNDAWFTGFAPANKPKLAVAVMVVGTLGFGGDVAAPIVASILSAGL